MHDDVEIVYMINGVEYHAIEDEVEIENSIKDEDYGL